MAAIGAKAVFEPFHLNQRYFGSNNMPALGHINTDSLPFNFITFYYYYFKFILFIHLHILYFYFAGEQLNLARALSAVLRVQDVAASTQQLLHQKQRDLL